MGYPSIYGNPHLKNANNEGLTSRLRKKISRTTRTCLCCWQMERTSQTSHKTRIQKIFSKILANRYPGYPGYPVLWFSGVSLRKNLSFPTMPSRSLSVKVSTESSAMAKIHGNCSSTSKMRQKDSSLDSLDFTLFDSFWCFDFWWLLTCQSLQCHFIFFKSFWNLFFVHMPAVVLFCLYFLPVLPFAFKSGRNCWQGSTYTSARFGSQESGVWQLNTGNIWESAQHVPVFSYLLQPLFCYYPGILV